MTSTSALQAGSSVESLCKKCKTVTDHHVVALVGDKIAKVQCKVCNARHAYQSPHAEKTPKQPATPKKARSAAPAKSARSTALTEQWEKMVSQATSCLPYAMDARFQVGDILEHPIFGRGYVQKCLRPNTVEVLFADQIRLLRCAAF
ncbi:MAG: hypothetical protein GX055_09375 [Desulfovibrionales bacterium]|nr:hypothetical protein [Desulfovibrionales bacterium]